MLHSEYLAKSFNYYYAEINSSLEEDVEYYNGLLETTYNQVAMEEFILNSLVPSGEFNGVPVSDYVDLVKVLANVYFVRHGCKNLPYPELGIKCKLYDWFLTSSIAYAEPDFFSKGENKEYEHSWDEDGFVKCWKGQG